MLQPDDSRHHPDTDVHDIPLIPEKLAFRRLYLRQSDACRGRDVRFGHGTNQALRQLRTPGELAPCKPEPRPSFLNVQSGPAAIRAIAQAGDMTRSRPRHYIMGAETAIFECGMHVK